jgi:hypothetical protein
LSRRTRELAAWLETPRGRTIARRVFAAFTLLLLTLTLWPALEVPIPIHRSDLIAHLTFFGTFGALAMCGGFFGPPRSDGNILRTLLWAAVFAGVDEGLQAIPALHRTCALDDYGANLIGLGLAAAMMLAWGRDARNLADEGR